MHITFSTWFASVGKKIENDMKRFKKAVCISNLILILFVIIDETFHISNLCLCVCLPATECMMCIYNLFSTIEFWRKNQFSKRKWFLNELNCMWACFENCNVVREIAWNFSPSLLFFRTILNFCLSQKMCNEWIACIAKQSHFIWVNNWSAWNYPLLFNNKPMWINWK